MNANVKHLPNGDFEVPEATIDPRFPTAHYGHDLHHSSVELPLGNPGTTLNPKDAIGSTKLPLHLWPAEATAMGCLGMLEGAAKYGRNNFIAGNGVIASIYVDAAKRHLDAWFAGEECSHDVGGPHLGNALATIAILVKAQAHGRLVDDRDYSPEPGGAAYRRFIEQLTPFVKKIQDLFKDKNPRHFTIKDTQP